jgi:hypothetical protein
VLAQLAYSQLQRQDRTTTTTTTTGGLENYAKVRRLNENYSKPLLFTFFTYKTKLKNKFS